MLRGNVLNSLGLKLKIMLYHCVRWKPEEIIRFNEIKYVYYLSDLFYIKLKLKPFSYSLCF